MIIESEIMMMIILMMIMTITMWNDDDNDNDNDEGHTMVMIIIMVIGPMARNYWGAVNPVGLDLSSEAGLTRPRRKCPDLRIRVGPTRVEKRVLLVLIPNRPRL